MMCAKLQLKEKLRPRERNKKSCIGRPKRYCQERLVNPNLDENCGWMNNLRSHYNSDLEPMQSTEALVTSKIQREEDLFLSVQNIEFQGDVKLKKRPKSFFKFKSATNGKEHRMFIREVVEEKDHTEEDRSSQLTYYFDDYVTYLLNAERSRSPSEKSSLIVYQIGDTLMSNKGTQVDPAPGFRDVDHTKKPEKKVRNVRKIKKTKQENELTNQIPLENYDLSDTNDTKVSFHTSGKRKSLTISRTQSPETVQVIRVDVVCNQSGSSKTSEYEGSVQTVLHNGSLDRNSLKTPHFANKYLLTNTIKAIDEKVSGGAKVTLLCKTFHLSDRCKVLKDKKISRNNLKSNIYVTTK